MDDPNSIPEIRSLNLDFITSHDWGRRGKLERMIQMSLARNKFGEDGIKALELHHLLDYIAYLCNSRKLNYEHIFTVISKYTRGMSEHDRWTIMRMILRDKDIVVKEIKISKNKIIERLNKVAEKLQIHSEVLDFIIINLDDIITDIYLSKGCESSS